MNNHNQKEGFKAEQKAVDFLKKRDYKVIDRNYHSRFGEIDIIALKSNILHFIEVKSGQGEPIYRVTSKKLSKIKKTIQFYLNQKKLDFDICIDIIEIKDNEINFIENITFF